MAFLDGFLNGVVSQRQRLEDQNREDAQHAQTREDAVLQHMATSDDPEIKALGVAGILHSTDPKKKKGGFAGWLGEMQSNPYMDKARALVAHDQAAGHLIPTEVAHAAGQHATAGDPAMAAATLVQGAQPGEPPPSDLPDTGVAAPPSTSAPAGSPAGPAEAPGAAPAPAVPSVVAAPEPATGAGSAAMTGGKSLTEVGSAPPSPTAAAAPQPPPQTAVPAALLGQPKPPADQAASPMAPPTSGMVGSTPPAAAPPPQPGVAPTAILGQAQPAAPPVGAGPGSPRGDVFRSPETQARKTKIASAQGDVEGLTAGLQAAGFSPEEIKAQLKLHYGRGTMGAGATGYQSVPGEMPDPDDATGKKMIQVNGAFDRARGTYIGTDPDSPYYGIPIPGFVSRQTGAQRQTPEQIYANAVARGHGANDAKLDAPIGVTAAERYGVPANTTLRQLTDKIPLSQADQDKIHGISTLDGSLNTIESLLPKVFPDVGAGFGARIKTALSLFAQSAGRQVDITALNAAIASTMAGIVRANGVTQRLNQKELDLAQQQMVDTSVLHGDTLDSAQEKMAILRDLISRVQSGPISLTVPGAPAPVGAPPPSPSATVGAAAAPPAPAAAPPASAAASGKTAPAPTKAGTGPQTPVAGLKMVNGVLVGADGKPY
jgi:hypothetical protein